MLVFSHFFFLMIRRPPRSTLSLHDALPICSAWCPRTSRSPGIRSGSRGTSPPCRSGEHTSELQSHVNLVCRLLLEKKKSCLTSFFAKLTPSDSSMMFYSFLG